MSKLFKSGQIDRDSMSVPIGSSGISQQLSESTAINEEQNQKIAFDNAVNEKVAQLKKEIYESEIIEVRKRIETEITEELEAHRKKLTAEYESKALELDRKINQVTTLVSSLTVTHLQTIADLEQYVIKLVYQALTKLIGEDDHFSDLTNKIVQHVIRTESDSINLVIRVPKQFENTTLMSENIDLRNLLTFDSKLSIGECFVETKSELKEVGLEAYLGKLTSALLLELEERYTSA